MFTFNPLFPDATDEQLLDQIRLWRKTELASCDWTQVADAPCDKAAWATYRQTLRDLPAQKSDPKKIKFPVSPNETPAD
jgi:hypothetical protein